MTSLCTWNVNGIRACRKKGLLDWLDQARPDLLCLQETKAQPDQLDEALLRPVGYQSWFASAQKRGYSGVALYARQEPVEVIAGLGLEEFDSEGRTQQIDLGSFVLLNCYFPNSQRSHARLPYKLAYDAALLDRCQQLRDQGREVAICGDFNAAHTEIDLTHPGPNKKNAGFLPEERAWVSQALDWGLVDVFRQRHPGEKGHHTWWSYRSNARVRNVGWRLDYFLMTPGLAERVRDVRHLAEVLGSDHCPVLLELDD